jgi:hypothetical protein
MNRLIALAIAATVMTGCLRQQVAPPPPVVCPPPIVSAEALYDQVQREGMETYQKHLNRHQNGDTVTIQTTQTIPDDDVRSGRLLLRLRRGALWIEGGGRDLVQAKLTHFEHQDVPQVLSVTSGFSRRVDIVARGNDDQWNLKLGDAIPMGLLIEAQSGYRNLNFDDVLLTDLSVQAGSGVTVLSIGGEQDFLTTASISQARGSIAANLSGEYDLLSSFEADTSDGDISGVFRGYYTRLRHMDIETTKGNVELDLTGAWRTTCEIKITCTGGNCTLFIPRGLGTSVKVKTACGKVFAPCMQKKWSSDSYINEAYEKTDQSLQIEVATTTGYVNIIQV